MNREMMRRSCFFWLLVPGLLMLSCGITPLSTKEVDLGHYVPRETIPLSVGLRIDEGVRSFCMKGPLRDVMCVRGNTLAALIEQASANTFQDVTLLSGKETPDALSARNIDATVSVKLIAVGGSDMDASMRPVPFGHSMEAHVILRWDIASLDGKPVYFCQIRGQGQNTVHWGFGAVEDRRQTYVAALRDHFQKTHKDIISSGWWKDRSWREK